MKKIDKILYVAALSLTRNNLAFTVCYMTHLVYKEALTNLMEIIHGKRCHLISEGYASCFSLD